MTAGPPVLRLSRPAAGDDAPAPAVRRLPPLLQSPVWFADDHLGVLHVATTSTTTGPPSGRGRDLAPTSCSRASTRPR